MRRRILITGAAGQLGEAMSAQLTPAHDVVALGRTDLDVASAPDVVRTVGAIRPDIVINCAAYTDVDGAEREPTTALAVNSWGPRALARAATEFGLLLVHYSTDFVFDGEIDTLHAEADPPNPRGTYAVSKLLGEWLAAETPRHYILRVESLFGGLRARSSVDKLLQGIRSGAEVRAFSDRTVSPSYVDDVVTATMSLVERGSPFGLYHCVNTGSTTWVGVARELARLAGRPDAPIREVKMSEARLLAQRPQFAALSNAKLTAAGVVMPTWQDALARYERRSRA